MVRLETHVDWIASVERDRALYGMSDRDFETLCNHLHDNPLLGKVLDASGLFVTEHKDHVVRYFVSPHNGSVTIMQIRPIGSVDPIITARLRGHARDILLFLIKQGVKKWLGF